MQPDVTILAFLHVHLNLLPSISKISPHIYKAYAARLFPLTWELEGLVDPVEVNRTSGMYGKR